MLNTLTTTVVGAIALVPSGAQQSAQEVFETMRARQIARWEMVDNYTIFQRMEGFEIPGLSESGDLEIPTHYQKHDIEGEPAFGIVPGNEYTIAVQQAGEGGEVVTTEFFELSADAQRMTADAFDDELAKSGMPMLPGMEYPGQMMRENAMFYDAGAQAIRAAEAGDFGRGNAAAELAAAREMARTMRLVGREEVDGRGVFHLRAEGLHRVVSQPGDDHRFTVRSASMWVDEEHYVPLRLSIEGDAEGDGERQSVTIERLFEDYRSVGPLYESHRQVMRLSGLMGEMDAKQREELENARRQMDELEAQLDQMPAAARGMVERQIARGKAQMEMLSGGGFELVTEVLRIEVNTGPAPPGTSRQGGAAARARPTAAQGTLEATFEGERRVFELVPAQSGQHEYDHWGSGWVQNANVIGGVVWGVEGSADDATREDRAFVIHFTFWLEGDGPFVVEPLSQRCSAMDNYAEWVVGGAVGGDILLGDEDCGSVTVNVLSHDAAAGVYDVEGTFSGRMHRGTGAEVTDGSFRARLAQLGS